MSREGKRGAISPGQLADLVVLTDDYFTVPDEEIKSLESVLTILGGKPVYAAEEFKPLDPGDLPVMPDWSPVHSYPGYWKPEKTAQLHAGACCGRRSVPEPSTGTAKAYCSSAVSTRTRHGSILAWSVGTDTGYTNQRFAIEQDAVAA